MLCTEKDTTVILRTFYCQYNYFVYFGHSCCVTCLCLQPFVIRGMKRTALDAENTQLLILVWKNLLDVCTSLRFWDAAGRLWFELNRCNDN